MDQTYVIPFIKTTRNLFETLFQMNVEVDQPSLKPPSESNYDVSGIIAFTGDIEGTVVLSFPLATAQRLVALFTGTESTAPDDLSDAIGEIVNMVVVGAKGLFDGKKITTGSPSVVVGSDHRIQQCKDAVSIIVPCQCDCGQFKVEVAFRGATAEAVAEGGVAEAQL